MDLTKKTVLVIGSGVSGIAATELLREKGITTILFDGNRELDADALRKRAHVFGSFMAVSARSMSQT